MVCGHICSRVLLLFCPNYKSVDYWRAEEEGEYCLQPPRANALCYCVLFVMSVLKPIRSPLPSKLLKNLQLVVLLEVMSGLRKSPHHSKGPYVPLNSVSYVIPLYSHPSPTQRPVRPSTSCKLCHHSECLATLTPSFQRPAYFL